MSEYDVYVAAGGERLSATLSVPSRCQAVVAFAHGSGSSRLSPRNRQVAAALLERGCATLLFDLLTADEAADRRNVFDIGLLAGRMVEATRWLRGQPTVDRVPLGYFGASTGAAAALVAAAELGDEIGAVVSRGGRPDLARDRLAQVTAPTLLIVGSRDTEVLELNRQALRRLRCENELAVIAGATHLFEEPGTLEQVAERAGIWFVDYLISPSKEGGR